MVLVPVQQASDIQPLGQQTRTLHVKERSQKIQTQAHIIDFFKFIRRGSAVLSFFFLLFFLHFFLNMAIKMQIFPVSLSLFFCGIAFSRHPVSQLNLGKDLPPSFLLVAPLGELQLPFKMERERETGRRRWRRRRRSSNCTSICKCCYCIKTLKDVLTKNCNLTRNLLLTNFLIQYSMYIQCTCFTKSKVDCVWVLLGLASSSFLCGKREREKERKRRPHQQLKGHLSSTSIVLSSSFSSSSSSFSHEKFKSPQNLLFLTLSFSLSGSDAVFLRQSVLSPTFGVPH